MSLQERLRAYRAELDGAIRERMDVDTEPVVPRPPRDRSRLVLTVAVAAVVAMLGSAIVGIVRHSDHGPSGPLTVEATLHATLDHRVRIESTLASGGSAGHIVTTGLYDFDRDVARIQTRIVGVPGRASSSGPEALYIHGTVYGRITADEARMLPEAVRRRVRWTVGRDPQAAGANGVGDPFTTIAALRREHLTLRDLGATSVDGQRVEHYVAVPVASPASTTTAGRVLGAVRYDLYVGGDRRLVRMVVTSPKIFSLRPVQQYDFSDYGVAVDVVAPPADQVVDEADLEIELAPPRLTGPWARVASGTTGGDAWKLYRAPADHERECWSFETDSHVLPQLFASAIIGGLTPTKPTPPLDHDGHSTVCTRTGIWASPLQYVFEGIDLTATPRLLDVGVVDRDVVSVDLVRNGATTPVVIDSRSHTFVVEQSLGDTFRLHLGDGRTIDCGTSRNSGADPAPTCPSTGL